MVPILVADANFKIVYTNEAVCKLIDCEAHELETKDFFGFLDPGHKELKDHLVTGTRNGAPYFHTSIFNTPGGQKIELTFKIYPVLDEDRDDRLYHVTVGVRSRIVSVAIARESKRDALRENYTHTSLSYAEGKALFDRVEAYVADEQAFLNPDLDLEQLSRELATNQLYLSQTVNFFAGLRFRDYINHHRVRYLERNASRFEDLPVSELWKAAGFGSYSAFRRFLQAAHHTTPKSFARQLHTASAQVEVDG